MNEIGHGLQSMPYRAIRLAVSAHEGQLRKGGEEFIHHPLRVAERLADWGCNQEIQAAGILHDTLEDTELDTDTIKLWTSDRVIELVELLTHQERDTFAKYIAKLAKDKDALTIKVADRIDNLVDSVNNTSLGFQKYYVEQTRKHFTENLLSHSVVLWNQLMEAVEYVEKDIRRQEKQGENHVS